MCNNTNIKLRNVMLITAIIGIAATILFVIFFDKGNFELIILPLIYYVTACLIVDCGFRWKFGKETRWVATLCFSPVLLEIFGVIIVRESVILIENFMKWYSMIGVTISVLIFEYKFFTHDKKQRK